MSLVAYLLNIPKAEKQPTKTIQQIRKEASEQRIVPYLEENGPQIVSALAKALGYTTHGLRIVLKHMERRGKVIDAGKTPGFRGRMVKLWGAPGQTKPSTVHCHHGLGFNCLKCYPTQYGNTNARKPQ